MENEKELRFLFVLPTATLGGAERVVFNFALFLLELGHHVTLYVMSRGKKPGWESFEKFPSCKIIFNKFDSEKRSVFTSVVAIRQLSRKNNYNYVFSSHVHVNAMLSMLLKANILRCTHLISRESTFIFERFFGVKRFIFFALYRFFYGAQSLLICQTEGMEASLIYNLGFRPVKKIAVIDNPINISYITNRVRTAEVPRVSGDVVNFVACGRLVPVKGFDVLIMAYAESLHSFHNTHLYIIGDGVECNRLEFLIAELGLSDHVTMLGHLGNPMPWFSVADVGVISSEREGFPNVLIEMMASGIKNIVATPCSDGIARIPNITVTRNSSVEALAKSISSAAAYLEDNRASYYRYVMNYRSMEDFWSKIQENIISMESER